MNYIAYKILNIILLKFYYLTYGVGLNSTKSQTYFFDFNHNSMHLGDRLFYFPAILQIILNGGKVCIHPKDETTFTMFKNLFGIELEIFTYHEDIDFIYVISAHSLFGNLKTFFAYKKRILISFDESSKKNVIEQINSQLELKEKFNWRTFLQKKSIENTQISGCQKVVLFSNYINSGFFRKYFIDERKLVQQAIKLKKEGWTVVHVGSRLDRQHDKVEYDFVDMDLRGVITIQEVILMISGHSQLLAVCYDNFIMHICHIYRRPTFVLFRGRFSRRAFDFHMRCVNETFTEAKQWNCYL